MTSKKPQSSSSRSPQSVKPEALPRDGRGLLLRLDALARLLGDESPTVWREIQREVDVAGKIAVPMLKRTARHDDSPRARARARQLLLARDRKLVVRRLIRFACKPIKDLERGLLLLARHHSPDLDVRPYKKALDGLAREVARRAANCRSDAERCRVLCEYLGRELRYGGELDDYHHPDNAHLHRTIERNTGLPLTVTALYMFVARRIGLRVAPLPLPGHVMLRAYGGEETVIVDPFYYGHVRTERECLQYLAQNGLKFQAEWFRDADDRTMFERQVMNLYKCYELRGLTRELRGLRPLMRVLRRPNGA